MMKLLKILVCLCLCLLPASVQAFETFGWNAVTDPSVIGYKLYILPQSPTGTASPGPATLCATIPGIASTSGTVSYSVVAGTYILEATCYSATAESGMSAPATTTAGGNTVYVVTVPLPTILNLHLVVSPTGTVTGSITEGK